MHRWTATVLCVTSALAATSSVVAETTQDAWFDTWSRPKFRYDVLSRTRRRIKEGDSHLIDSYRVTHSKALNIAQEIITDISPRDCAVYCATKSCGIFSYREDTMTCRVGCITCRKWDTKPVTQLGSEYFQMSLDKVAFALVKILTSGAASHQIDVKPSQIRRLENPLAPENVLTEPDSPIVVVPVLPQSNTTEPPSPGGVTEKPTTTTTTDNVVVLPPLAEDCGVRPVFGLVGDNMRLLEPTVLEQNRVIGGTEVDRGTYPWQAQINVLSGVSYEHSCGGIVISEDLILTAAHCHKEHDRNYEIRVGQHSLKEFDPGERVLPVENIVSHYLYRTHLDDGKASGERNDIALIKLKFQYGTPQRLEFNDYVQPVCLPPYNLNLTVGQQCQISGWGLTNASAPRTADNAARVLRGAVVPILDPEVCARAYGDSFDRDLMICAGFEEGGTDTCSGDSGGPLSCRDEQGLWFVAGVVSFGWGCGKAGFPGVYTRVSAYTYWIHDKADLLANNGQRGGRRRL